VAVVTGAGSGIGRATALALAARGLDVCCAGRRLEPLQETAAQLSGGRGRAVAADVSTADGVRAVASAVGGAPVAALVHAAAIEGIVSLEETTRPVFDRLVAVNLAGPFFLTQALRPRLASGSGIVFVGSVSALHGRPRHAAYAATKAALLGLTTSLAAELAPRVRVNCVAPGATDTPMMAEALTAYLRSMDAEEAHRTGTAEMARVPLGRVGTPGELAAAIVHLALDASYSTGSVVTIDGGFSARLPRGRQHHQQEEAIMQRARSAAVQRHGPKPGLSPRVILIADAAWDAILGAGLIAASAGSVTSPLGAGPLRPVPVPVAVGAVCLVVAALMFYASTGTQAAAACRLAAPANAAGAIAGIALLITFPAAAHPYVTALAVASTGCAVFATLEYQTKRPESAPE
jgi:3-oxoacyl-[acyl-carrier protein] reductase